MVTSVISEFCSLKDATNQRLNSLYLSFIRIRYAHRYVVKDVPSSSMSYSHTPILCLNRSSVCDNLLCATFCRPTLPHKSYSQSDDCLKYRVKSRGRRGTSTKWITSILLSTYDVNAHVLSVVNKLMVCNRTYHSALQRTGCVRRLCTARGRE